MQILGKYLFITFGDVRKSDPLLDSINKTVNVYAACAFSYQNKVKRVLRRFSIEHDFPGIGYWLNDWKRNVSSFDVIILTASRYSVHILKWLRSQYPDKHLINYYWDKVDISHYPVEKSQSFENWSFDLDDCKKYGFKYNPQFYCSSMMLPEDIIKYDLSFVGADREGLWKNRVNLANKYYRLFKDYNLNLFFYLVTNSAFADKEITHTERLSEREYLRVTSQSRAILDIVEPGMEWMTLRPLLAISNQKKLVTNYSGIKNERFYSKENVFILEEDPVSELRTFLSSPFKPLRPGILEYYDVENWAERFVC